MPMQPASTNKVLTAAAALLTLDRDAKVSTTVVAAADGRSSGVVVLVGGGDTTLSAAPPGVNTWYKDAARISDLAGQVRRSGFTPTAVRSTPRSTAARGWPRAGTRPTSTAATSRPSSR